MSTTTINPVADEEVELREAVKQIFQQIDKVNERIQRNQTDIDRLKAETQAMLAQLKIGA